MKTLQIITLLLFLGSIAAATSSCPAGTSYYYIYSNAHSTAPIGTSGAIDISINTSNSTIWNTTTAANIRAYSNNTTTQIPIYIEQIGSGAINTTLWTYAAAGDNITLCLDSNLSKNYNNATGVFKDTLRTYLMTDTSDANNNYNLTAAGSPATTTGKIGGAYQFGGTSDAFIANDAGLPTNPSYTICGWYNLSATGAWRSRWAWGDSVTYGNGIISRTSDGGAANSYTTWKAATNAQGSAFSAGVWKYECVVDSGTGANQVLIYQDGISNANATVASQALTLSNVANGFRIGAINESGTMIQFWIGKIDNVQIWNSALTASQMAYIYSRNTTLLSEGAVVTYGNLTVNYTVGIVNATGANDSFIPPMNLTVNFTVSAGYYLQSCSITEGNATVISNSSLGCVVQVLDSTRANVQGSAANICRTLSTAGATETLNQNLQINGSTCFNITAQNITINCNGYSITGNNTTSTYGIYSNQFNTTIKNCNISNFGTGLFFNNATNGTIQNTTSKTTGGGLDAIASDYPSGIFLRNSSYVQVNNSTAYSLYGNGFSIAIGSYYNNVSNLVATTGHISGSAFVLACANAYNTITNLKAYDDGGTVSDKTFGIAINGGFNNTITNFSTNSSGTSCNYGGGDYYCFYPIFLEGLCANVYNNTFSGGNVSGRSGATAAPLITVTYSAANVYQNTFFDNNFSANPGGKFVIDNNGGNYYNNSVEGNIWQDVVNGTVNITGNVTSSWFSSMYIGFNGTGYPYNSTTSTRVTGMTDYHPLTPFYYNSTGAANSPPVMSSVSINNSTGGTNFYIGDVLFAWAKYNDSDNTTATINGTWKLNGANNTTFTQSNVANNTNTNVANMTSAIAKGQNWSFCAFAYDGVDSSAELCTTNITINNSKPVVSDIQFFNSANSHSFVANITATDANGGTDLTASNCTTTSGTCVYLSNFTSGNTRYFSYNVSGTSPSTPTITIGTTDSSGAYASMNDQHAFPDHASNLTKPSVSAIIYPTSNATCTAGIYADLDGDTENASARNITWQLNGITNTSCSGINCLLSNIGAKIGDNVSCSENATNSTWNSSYAYDMSDNVSVKIGCSVLSIDNSSFTLTENLSINGSTCFTVSAQNVTIDCNGFSITGNNTVSAYGVYSNQFNTTVKNCNISRFGNQVGLFGASSATIQNNNLTVDFGSGATAIYTAGAANNGAFTGNRITASDVSHGVYIAGGSNIVIDCNGYSITGNNTSATYGIYSNQFNTTIRNCNISNFATGIYFLNAANGTIDSTNASTTSTYANPSGLGIYINGNADGNTISNSIGTSTTNGGIRLDSCNFNQIISSTGSGAYGIYLQSSASDNMITDSIGSSDAGYGLIINLQSSNNTITNSTFTSNSAIGIYISASSNNTINNSVARNLVSSGYGLRITSGSNDTRVINTTASSNTSSAIYIDGGSNVSIDCQGKSIVGTNASGTYGIYSNQFNTTVKNCNISNFATGIYFAGATNGTIQGTNASTTRSGGVGIYLYNGANYTAITGSTGASATNRGIYFDTSSNGNTVSGCQITGNDNTNGALTIYAGSSNNTIANSTINGQAGAYAIALRVGANSGNLLINNTFLNATNLLHLDANASGNTFYWNNFTDTSGLYVSDANGSNYYNTTINGRAAGNIYANVLNGSVPVYGATASPFTGLYYGTSGTGVPYNNSTSNSKFSCDFAGCADYAPLTNLTFIQSNGSEIQIGYATPNTMPKWNVSINVSGSGNCTYNISHLAVQNSTILDKSGNQISNLGNTTSLIWACNSTSSNYSINFTTETVIQDDEGYVTYASIPQQYQKRIYIHTSIIQNISYNWTFATGVPSPHLYTCSQNNNSICVSGTQFYATTFDLAGGIAWKATTLTSNETVWILAWDTVFGGTGGGADVYYGIPSGLNLSNLSQNTTNQTITPTVPIKKTQSPLNKLFWTRVLVNNTPVGWIIGLIAFVLAGYSLTWKTKWKWAALIFFVVVIAFIYVSMYILEKGG
jgi:parallel beta-helix repeat protein